MVVPPGLNSQVKQGKLVFQRGTPLPVGREIKEALLLRIHSKTAGATSGKIIIMTNESNPSEARIEIPYDVRIEFGHIDVNIGMGCVGCGNGLSVSAAGLLSASSSNSRSTTTTTTTTPKTKTKKKGRKKKFSSSAASAAASKEAEKMIVTANEWGDLNGGIFIPSLGASVDVDPSCRRPGDVGWGTQCVLDGDGKNGGKRRRLQYVALNLTNHFETCLQVLSVTSEHPEISIRTAGVVDGTTSTTDSDSNSDLSSLYADCIPPSSPWPPLVVVMSSNRSGVMYSTR